VSTTFLLNYIKSDDAIIAVAQFAGDNAITTIAQVGSNVKVLFFHVVGIDFVVVASYGLTTTIAQAFS
jgi:hypothetical protein